MGARQKYLAPVMTVCLGFAAGLSWSAEFWLRFVIESIQQLHGMGV